MRAEVKVAFLVDSLSSSQKSYEIIRLVNKLVEQGESCIIGVQEISSPCLACKAPIYDIVELFNSPIDIMISTSVSTTLKSLKMFGPKRRIYYLYEIFWKGKQVDWKFVMDPRLEVFARGASYRDLVASCFNRDVGIFDIERLLSGSNA